MSEEEDEFDCTPPEVREKGITATLDMLSKKSKDKYEKQYEIFVEWCTKHRVTKYSENVLMGYFGDTAEKYAPPTLWSYYFMLKATLNVKNNIDIGTFKKLVPFLKQKAKGYTPKKTKTLSQEEIISFMLNAPDNIYLMMKVCMIFGIAGACRADELVKLKINEIEDKESILIVHIPKSKTDKPRTFIITAEFEGSIKPIELYRKYLALRPSHIEIDRFFLSYRGGKCTIQPVGIHTIGGIPSKIASYLNLSDSALYTGHCYRRTSATLFANAGGSKENLKRHGGWKSDSVAESYVEESILNKTKIAKTILGGVHVQQQTSLINNSSVSKERGVDISPEFPQLCEYESNLISENLPYSVSSGPKTFSVSGDGSTSGINFYNASGCSFNFTINNIIPNK